MNESNDNGGAIWWRYESDDDTIHVSGNGPMKGFVRHILGTYDDYDLYSSEEESSSNSHSLSKMYGK